MTKSLWIILFTTFFFFSGCASGPQVSYTPIKYNNDCMVVAEGYQAAYAAKQNQQAWFWTKVLIIQYSYRDPKFGPNSHAVCIVEWKNNDGHTALYAYDPVFGSMEVGPPELKDSPKGLANVWCIKYAKKHVDAFYF